ncbi:MAG TPA: PP2C family serine/threonine-protein phosphatase [Propionibacteriaceae bacterium]|nr:PP2C family serine/threonine-protein phosphatase [Propionibacteriaceae bacterium]
MTTDQPGSTRAEGLDDAFEPTHVLWPGSAGQRHPTPLRSSGHLGAAVGAASDVGHRHSTNQDAYRIALVPSEGRRPVILIIADGVSSTLDSDLASDRAVAAALDHISGFVAEHPEATSEEQAEVLAAAFALANAAVVGNVQDPAAHGSCTLIAGVATDVITVASIGDSRAYWFGDDGAVLRLSIDDSVTQARIELGMTPEEAEQGVNAHAITRWLGANAEDVTPRVLGFRPGGPGWLLLCSDGLWNYAPDARTLAQLLSTATADASAEDASQRLVDWALAQGGRDNVTVALARWEPLA